MLPRIHRIRIRDEVGLREGEDGYGSLPGAENLVEGRRNCGVESPSPFTSDEKECTRPFLYRDGQERGDAQKSRVREDENCTNLKLGALFSKKQPTFSLLATFFTFFL